MSLTKARSGIGQAESAEERIVECVSRIEAENDQYHAVSCLLQDQAIARARALDADRNSSGKVGKLHGMPFLAKELIDLKGYPTPFGSHAYSKRAAADSATAIKRLEEAGAILVGTTHMVEFAIGSWGTNHAKGTPWNPSDKMVHRVPGGSSSGSAVAVAAGFVPVAIGSDTGGSVRIPASLCGVVGYKPTFGLIPINGVAPLGPTFDTLGTLTRNVQDARASVEVMADTQLGHPQIEFEGLNLATVKFEDLEPISADVAEGFVHTLGLLRDLGAEISDVPLPFSFPEFQALNGTIVAYEAYGLLGDIVRDARFPIDPYVRGRVMAGRDIDQLEYDMARRKLEAAQAEFTGTLGPRTALLLPGTPMCAVPVDEVDESEIPMSRYTRIANCLNMCALTLPLSRLPDQLPVGFQMCAPGGQDSFLLALAEQIEQVVRTTTAV